MPLPVASLAVLPVQSLLREPGPGESGVVHAEPARLLQAYAVSEPAQAETLTVMGTPKVLA